MLYKVSWRQENRVWFVKEYLLVSLKYRVHLYFLNGICSTTLTDKQLCIYCQQFVSTPAAVSLTWLKKQGLSALGNDFRLSLLAWCLFFNNADYQQHDVQGKRLWMYTGVQLMDWNMSKTDYWGWRNEKREITLKPLRFRKHLNESRHKKRQNTL